MTPSPTESFPSNPSLNEKAWFAPAKYSSFTVSSIPNLAAAKDEFSNGFSSKSSKEGNDSDYVSEKNGSPVLGNADEIYSKKKSESPKTNGKFTNKETSLISKSQTEISTGMNPKEMCLSNEDKRTYTRSKTSELSRTTLAKLSRLTSSKTFTAEILPLDAEPKPVVVELNAEVTVKPKSILSSSANGSAKKKPESDKEPSPNLKETIADKTPILFKTLEVNPATPIIAEVSPVKTIAPLVAIVNDIGPESEAAPAPPVKTLMPLIISPSLAPSKPSKGLTLTPSKFSVQDGLPLIQVTQSKTLKPLIIETASVSNPKIILKDEVAELPKELVGENPVNELPKPIDSTKPTKEESQVKPSEEPSAKPFSKPGILKQPIESKDDKLKSKSSLKNGAKVEDSLLKEPSTEKPISPLLKKMVDKETDLQEIPSMKQTAGDSSKSLLKNGSTTKQLNSLEGKTKMMPYTKSNTTGLEEETSMKESKKEGPAALKKFRENESTMLKSKTSSLKQSLSSKQLNVADSGKESTATIGTTQEPQELPVLPKVEPEAASSTTKRMSRSKTSNPSQRKPLPDEEQPKEALKQADQPVAPRKEERSLSPSELKKSPSMPSLTKFLRSKSSPREMFAKLSEAENLPKAQNPLGKKYKLPSAISPSDKSVSTMALDKIKSKSSSEEEDSPLNKKSENLIKNDETAPSASPSLARKGKSITSLAAKKFEQSTAPKPVFSKAKSSPREIVEAKSENSSNSDEASQPDQKGELGRAKSSPREIEEPKLDEKTLNEKKEEKKSSLKNLEETKPTSIFGKKGFLRKPKEIVKPAQKELSVPNLDTCSKQEPPVVPEIKEEPKTVEIPKDISEPVADSKKLLEPEQILPVETESFPPKDQEPVIPNSEEKPQSAELVLAPVEALPTSDSLPSLDMHMDEIKKLFKAFNALYASRSTAEPNAIVKINIGGNLFSTYKSTLLYSIEKSDSEYYEPHLLQRLINGTQEASYDEDGAIFIDKNAFYFNYVIDYLRSLAAPEQHNFELPRREEVLKGIIKEADFFQLDGLKSSAQCLFKSLQIKHFRSSILSDEEKKTLINLCNLTDRLELIYRASYHGFSAKEFHSKCDGISRTLTIIKTTKNNVFGGYTEAAWSQSRAYCADKNAYVFSLINKVILVVNVGVKLLNL